MKAQRNIFANCVAALFIFLFTYTGASKLWNNEAFRATLAGTPFMGHWAPLVAVVLPWGELAVAGLLFFPATRRVGMYASLVLMILFTVYLGVLILSGLDLPCSCAGVFQSMNWTQHLLVNVLLTALTGVAVAIGNQHDAKTVIGIRPERRPGQRTIKNLLWP